MSDIKNFTNNCSLRQHLFALCKYLVIGNMEGLVTLLFFKAERQNLAS